MSLSRLQVSPPWNLVVSFAALIVAGYARELWFSAGGWHRYDHTQEALLWTGSAAVGVLAVVNAVRMDRGRSAVTVIAALLCAGHLLSALLLYMFIRTLESGGPR